MKIGLVACLLSGGLLHGSSYINGDTKMIEKQEMPSTEDFIKKMRDLTDDTETSPSIKLFKLRLYLQELKDEYGLSFLRTLMNPKKDSTRRPLLEAHDACQSIEFFILCLKYCAEGDYTVDGDEEETIADRVASYGDKKYNKAIKDQKRYDLLVPAIRQLIAGEDQLEVAQQINALIEEKSLSEQEVSDILESIASTKNLEVKKMINLWAALEFKEVRRPDSMSVKKKKSHDKERTQEFTVEKLIRQPIVQLMLVSAAVAGAGGAFLYWAFLQDALSD